MMNYKGYIGQVVYDDEAQLLHGEVINMRDIVTFQAGDVAGLQQAFKDSVDDYIEFCEEEGVKPEKPYSGKFQTRVSPLLHRDLSTMAKLFDKSLNGLVEEVLAEKVQQFNCRKVK